MKIKYFSIFLTPFSFPNFEYKFRLFNWSVTSFENVDGLLEPSVVERRMDWQSFQLLDRIWIPEPRRMRFQFRHFAGNLFVFAFEIGQMLQIIIQCIPLCKWLYSRVFWHPGCHVRDDILLPDLYHLLVIDVVDAVPRLSELHGALRIPTFQQDRGAVGCWVGQVLRTIPVLLDFRRNFAFGSLRWNYCWDLVPYPLQLSLFALILLQIVALFRLPAVLQCHIIELIMDIFLIILPPRRIERRSRFYHRHRLQLSRRIAQIRIWIQVFKWRLQRFNRRLPLPVHHAFETIDRQLYLLLKFIIRHHLFIRALLNCLVQPLFYFHFILL